MTSRLGIVSYANVAPLVEGLASSVDFVRLVPSELSEAMRQGRVDVGILPVIELARMPGARALPGWGIAADEACDSVLLFSKRPLGEIRSVALDPSSRTSNVLVRIVLDRAGARDARFDAAPSGGLEQRLESADAALLIGDPALAARAPQGVERLDLATEWKRLTGLPFVFATWVARPGHEPDVATLRALDAAATRGLGRHRELAQLEARRTGLPEALLERYFGVLDYRLEDRHWTGLRHFLDEAFRIGQLPAKAAVEILA